MQAFGEDAPHHVSLALLEDMLRRIIKEELKAAMHQDTVDDADYLASLPPEERKAKLKEMKK
jgi:hypothetical protein